MCRNCNGSLQKLQKWKLAVLLAAFFPQMIVRSAGDPSTSKSGGKSATPTNSSSKTGLDVLYALVAIVAVVLLAVFLYKLWQKKKREEQHARLLRLFEEDDELELELGLRD